jgi:hypothetical protein
MSRPALGSSELRLRLQIPGLNVADENRSLKRRQQSQTTLRAGAVSHHCSSDCMEALSFRAEQRPDIGNRQAQVACLDDELEPSPE